MLLNKAKNRRDWEQPGNRSRYLRHQKKGIEVRSECKIGAKLTLIFIAGDLKNKNSKFYSTGRQLECFTSSLPV